MRKVESEVKPPLVCSKYWDDNYFKFALIDGDTIKKMATMTTTMMTKMMMTVTKEKRGRLMIMLKQITI